MANTVISNIMKTLDQGPTQSSSCLASHWLIVIIYAQRSVHYNTRSN